MIRLQSNSANNVTFVSTTPPDFTLTLKSNMNSDLFTFQLKNVRSVNCRARFRLTKIQAGEYNYTISHSSTIFEQGIAVVSDSRTNNKKTYGSTSKFKSYQKQ